MGVRLSALLKVVSHLSVTVA